MEYLLIVALTFVLVVPSSYLFYNYSRDSSQELVDAQITNIGRTIINSAESLFYSGQGSKTTLEVNVPDNVASSVIIDGKELVFNVTTPFGTSEIVFFSSINLTTDGANCNGNICSLAWLGSPGFKKVKLETVSLESVRITTA